MLRANDFYTVKKKEVTGPITYKSEFLIEICSSMEVFHRAMNSLDDKKVYVQNLVLTYLSTLIYPVTAIIYKLSILRGTLLTCLGHQ